MRIHEVEIYSSKQINAFIEYLKVLAEEKKVIEDMQSHYSNANMLMQGNCIGSQIGSVGAAAVTPEYLAKLAAQRAADQACQKPDEKCEA